MVPTAIFTMRTYFYCSDFIFPIKKNKNRLFHPNRSAMDQVLLSRASAMHMCTVLLARLFSLFILSILFESEKAVVVRFKWYLPKGCMSTCENGEEQRPRMLLNVENTCCASYISSHPIDPSNELIKHRFKGK